MTIQEAKIERRAWGRLLKVLHATPVACTDQQYRFYKLGWKKYEQTLKRAKI